MKQEGWLSMWKLNGISNEHISYYYYLNNSLPDTLFLKEEFKTSSLSLEINEYIVAWHLSPTQFSN